MPRDIERYHEIQSGTERYNGIHEEIPKHTHCVKGRVESAYTQHRGSVLNHMRRNRIVCPALRDDCWNDRILSWDNANDCNTN